MAPIASAKSYTKRRQVEVMASRKAATVLAKTFEFIKSMAVGIVVDAFADLSSKVGIF